MNKPPIFRNWSHWYIFIVAWLAALIVLFYFFTKHFS